MSDNEKIERLKDIKVENIVWFIYIGIIFLSFYANRKKKKYILYNDNIAKKEYQNIIKLVLLNCLIMILKKRAMK